MHRIVATAASRRPLHTARVLRMSFPVRLGMALLGRLLRPLQDRGFKLPFAGQFTRKNMAIGCTILSAGVGGYYVAHQDVNPITGRSQFLLFTDAEMRRMGQAAFDATLKERKGLVASSDDPDSELVISIVSRLAKNPAAALHNWTIAVVKDANTVNAIAFPSGHIIVYTGILNMINRDRDELAYLIGHEMAHVICRHTSERLSLTHFIGDLHNVVYFTAFSLVGDIFSFATLFGIMFFGDKAASFLTERSFSRENELEADKLGTLMAAEACFDPRVAPGVWARMARARDPEQIDLPEWGNTHPSDDHRCAELEALMPEVLAASSSINCPPSATARAKQFFSSWLYARVGRGSDSGGGGAGGAT